MKRTATSLLLLLPLASFSLAQDLHDRAIRLQKSAIIVDSHEDVPERLGKEWVDIGVRGKTGHVDIPRLTEGGVTAPFFAAYVPAAFATSGGAARKTLELIDLIHRLVESHPNDLILADSVAGIRAAKR
jgi:membrane dipeptidase